MNTNVTLDEVIRSLIIETGKSSENDYQRFIQLGVQGLKELNFDILKNIKSVKLNVDSSLSVSLPADYVGYTKIGIHKDDNRVHVLGLDNKRYLGTDAATNIESTSDDYYIFRNFMFKGVEGEMYGIGGGNNGNGLYKEDRNNNRILFKSLAQGDQIVLEYISDGITGLDGDEIKVHPYAEEALRSYIFWKSVQRKRGIPQFEKESARRDFYNEKRLARARLSKFTIDEAYQTSRRGFKQSPKI